MVAPTTPSIGGRFRQSDPALAKKSRDRAKVDADLVCRFNGGDEAAFDEIVARHRGRLFQIALGVLRNRADAEEVAQDTLIRAHRGLARFRGDSSLATWLCRIALNLSRNRLHYNHRRRAHAMLPLDAQIRGDNPATFADLVACSEPGPLREVVNKEFAVVVSDCTSRLTHAQQEILSLRGTHHRSYQAIGVMLGIQIGTVKSRIARARSVLRDLVAKAYPEFDRSDNASGPFESIRSTGRIEAVRP